MIDDTVVVASPRLTLSFTAMLFGMSWEWVVLLACSLLLLPRLVGVLVNVVLFAALQTQPDVNVSIAGISLRRVTEINVELLRIPLSPLLAARILISIDEVALTPSWSKWLTVAVRGAKAHLILTDVAPSAPQSANGAASVRGAASQTASTARRKLSRSAPTSIPDLLSTLSSSAPSATLPPVQRGYQYICNRLLITVFHAIAVSLSSVLVIVQKDQFRASVRLASLLLYVDRANSNSSRLQQLNVKLGGIEVRVGTTAESDMLQYPAIESDWTSTFVTKQRPSASFDAAATTPSTSVPALRTLSIATATAPPLLVLHPLQLMVEFTLHRYVPTGITRVETRAQGLSVHVDVMRLIAAASTALQAFHTLIVTLQRQMQNAANEAADEVVAAQAAEARLNSPLGSPVLPIFARGMSFRPQQTTREAALQRDRHVALHPHLRPRHAHPPRQRGACTSERAMRCRHWRRPCPATCTRTSSSRYGTSASRWLRGRSSLPLAPSPVTAAARVAHPALSWSCTGR